MALNCHMACSTKCNPWTVASPLAFNISVLELHTPSRFLPFNFTASLKYWRGGGVSSNDGLPVTTCDPARGRCLLWGFAMYNNSKYLDKRAQYPSTSGINCQSLIQSVLTWKVDLRQSFFRAQKIGLWSFIFRQPLTSAERPLTYLS